MITTLVLAAGLSTRFGCPKALATIQNKPAINFLLEKLVQSQISEIVVVLGSDLTQIEPVILNHKIIHIVYNKDYKFGQTSSVQAGLNTISPTSTGIMLCPVDCPFIEIETINHLVKEFNKKSPAVLIPTFKNQRGHPPVLNTMLIADIQKLNHSQGINTVFKKTTKNIASTLEIPDPGIIKTFNTPDELLSIKKELKLI